MPCVVPLTISTFPAVFFLLVFQHNLSPVEVPPAPFPSHRTFPSLPTPFFLSKLESYVPRISPTLYPSA